MARAFVGLHRERVWERFMREGEVQHGGSKRGWKACCARTLVFMGAVCQHERRRFFDLRVLREQELQRGLRPPNLVSSCCASIGRVPYGSNSKASPAL